MQISPISVMCELEPPVSKSRGDRLVPEDWLLYALQYSSHNLDGLPQLVS
jgi:hypothetical protein